MNDAWFYRVGESQLGPVPMIELQRLMGSGQIGPSVALWREGMPGWVAGSSRWVCSSCSASSCSRSEQYPAT